MNALTNDGTCNETNDGNQRWEEPTTGHAMRPDNASMTGHVNVLHELVRTSCPVRCAALHCVSRCSPLFPVVLCRCSLKRGSRCSTSLIDVPMGSLVWLNLFGVNNDIMGGTRGDCTPFRAGDNHHRLSVVRKNPRRHPRYGARTRSAIDCVRTQRRHRYAARGPAG